MTGSTSGPRAPGTILLKLARLLFNEQLLLTVIQPTISDLQREVAAAGQNGLNRLRARWRGYLAFWKLVLIAPFVSWPSPVGHRVTVAFPDVVARLAVALSVVGLLAVGGPVLAAWVVVVTVAGALIAIAIHVWYDRHPSELPTPTELQRRSPQINFSSTQVAGNIGGLIFVVGSLFIVVVGLPSVIWFLFAGTIAGGVLAWRLAAWHTNHPERGRPGNQIVLR